MPSARQLSRPLHPSACIDVHLGAAAAFVGHVPHAALAAGAAFREPGAAVHGALQGCVHAGGSVGCGVGSGSGKSD